MELLEYKMLLEQYYEGNTTVEEERGLKIFLAMYSGEDAALLEAKEYFNYLNKGKEKSVAINFDAIIQEKPKRRLRRIIPISSAIAAVFIVGLLIASLMQNKEEPVIYAYVNGQAITNKKEALMFSSQALKAVSDNLNKGTQNLSYINKLNEPVKLITTNKQ